MRITSWFIFIFFVTGQLCMQSVSGQANKVRFTHFTVEDGLTQNSGLDILEDSFGYIWIGTQDGLNRYNGYTFAQFRSDPEDPESLMSGYIRTLYEDQQNQIWVGTANGLHLFNAHDQKFKHFDIFNILLESGVDSTQISREVLTMAQANSDEFWLGTPMGLVYLNVEEERAQRVDYGAGSLGEVNTLMADHEGNLWIGDHEGNVVRRSLMLSSENSAGDNQIILKSDVHINTIHIDSNGDVWIGTEGEGLFRYNSSGDVLVDQDVATKVDIDLAENLVRAIHTDTQGRLWIGYSREGVSLFYSEDNVRHFTRDPSGQYGLKNEEVKEIFVDKTGVVWIGTWEGVSRMSPSFETLELYVYSDQDGALNDGRVVAFEEEKEDTYWIGTMGGGLFQFERSTGEFTAFNAQGKQGSLCGDEIYDLQIDSDRKLWIAALGDGLCSLDLSISDTNRKSTGFTSYDRIKDAQDMSMGHSAISVLPVTDSLMLIGTWQAGLHMYNRIKNTLSVFTDSSETNALLNNYLWPLVQDDKGNVWGAAHGKGLFYYDHIQGQITNHILDNGNENSNLIFDLYFDSQKDLWAATNDGVKLINPATMEMKTYRVEDGLPNNSARGLVEDDFGNMWISTNNGLARFSPVDSTFKNFYIEDGLQGNQFYARSVMKASNGKLFFGGYSGFNIVDPSLFKPDSIAPKIVLDKILVNNNPYQKEGEPAPYLRDNLILEHYENKFSLSFTSLNFTNVSKNKYKYRLSKTKNKWDPFQATTVDTSWTFLDTENEVTFPLQTYGDYLFEVLGTNSDGVWGTEGLSLPITIKTPWYAQTWFRGLIVLSIIGVIVGGFMLRIREERREAAFLLKTERIQSNHRLRVERIRLDIARDLHDNAGANLATIGLHLSMLKKQLQFSAKEEARMHKLNRLVRQTGQAIRETGWIINARYDNLHNLVNQMSDLASLMLEGQREFKFRQSPNPMPDLQMEMDYKQNVYYLFKEALNNANKYSEAANICIDVTYENEILSLQIKDNGVGFDMEHVKEGSGLQNMLTRAKEINGSYQIQSEPGKGTTIRVSAPLTEQNSLDIIQPVEGTLAKKPS